jgi:hypothetical protein
MVIFGQNYVWVQYTRPRRSVLNLAYPRLHHIQCIDLNYFIAEATGMGLRQRQVLKLYSPLLGEKSRSNILLYYAIYLMYVSVICLQLFSIVYTGFIASWLTICLIANWYILVLGTANNDFEFQLCDLHISSTHVTVILPCIQYYLY